MKYVQWIIILSGAFLQVLVISALVRRSYREFPLLLAYVTVSLLATVVEVSASLDLMGWSRVTTKYYWINEAILQFLIFLLVLSLVHRAMQGVPQRPAVMRWLVFLAFAFTSVSFLLDWGEPLSRLMTQVARNVSFAAVLMNLVLWLMLIRHHVGDPRVFLISCGLGIQMAGEAMGHAMRQLAIPRRSAGLVLAGNLVLTTSHLLCLFIWWRALRRPLPASVARQPASL